MCFNLHPDDIKGQLSGLLKHSTMFILSSVTFKRSPRLISLGFNPSFNQPTRPLIEII